jgi:adenosine/AMP kinase
MAGYSKTPLVKKLGIKEGFKISILNAPENYAQTLGELPENVTVVDILVGPLDFIHFFTTSRETLTNQFPQLKQALASNGMLWISWPKRSAKVETNLTEDIIRAIGLDNSLVDVKVAAVDEIWSGLKFVYRLKDR